MSGVKLMTGGVATKKNRILGVNPFLCLSIMAPRYLAQADTDTPGLRPALIGASRLYHKALRMSIYKSQKFYNNYITKGIKIFMKSIKNHYINIHILTNSQMNGIIDKQILSREYIL